MSKSNGVSLAFPAEAATKEYAASLDSSDRLAAFREKFIVPSKANIASKKLAKPGLSPESCIYFCGNSLGIQPKATAKYLEAQLDTWSSIGVGGHFTDLEGSPLKQWQLLSEQAADSMSKIVGAKPEEVAAMGTLTTNLHLLLASFYKPTQTKHKILMDWKAFPSDHYAIESHIAWHDLDPKESMVLIGPDEGEYEISTQKIFSYIDKHADEAAMILLPGIQYYTGQLFDIQKITKYAHSRNMVVGWDLAHAFANVELKLHDWNVDFAAWCTYKYGNAGPGAMGGLFVHEQHGEVDYSAGEDAPKFRHRLTGWYGGDRSSSNLFLGQEDFRYQILRPSTLRVFVPLEFLLLRDYEEESRPFSIITPKDPEARGAQLSLLLKPGLLQNVAQKLQEAGIVCDKREPGVVRVAPVPLYNSFSEVWTFVKIFKDALQQ